MAHFDTTPRTSGSAFAGTRLSLIIAVVALVAVALVTLAQGTVPAEGIEDWHGNVSRSM